MKNNVVLKKEGHSPKLLGIFRVRNAREMKQSKGDEGKIASGFTLIELLVVVLVIAILAAIAVPQYQKAVIKFRAVQLQTLLDSVVKAGNIYFLNHGQYPTSLDALDLGLDFAPTSSVSTTSCGSALVPTSVKKGKDFELVLYDGGIAGRISAAASFTTGKYKCTGFIHHFKFPDNTALEGRTFCGEHYYNRACGSSCDWDMFCDKIMGKKFIGYFNLLRLYQ